MSKLTQLVEDVRNAVEQLAMYVDQHADELTLEDLVDAEDRLSGDEGLRTAFSAVQTSLAQELAGSLPADVWEVELPLGRGVRTVERHWSASGEKWDKERAWGAVVAAADEQGYDVTTVLHDVVGVGYFRKRQLRKLGLDPDSFLDAGTGGKWRVVVS